jgi:hypothetical protein
LDGFSDAIIMGNFTGFSGNTRDADDGSIWFYYDQGGYHTFGLLDKGVIMTFTTQLSFDITNDGVIVLTHELYDMYNDFKDFEIQYKYQDDELVLFNYTRYGHAPDYPEGEEYKTEIIEFVRFNNKMILRNYKKDENKEGRKNKIVFINQDTDELKNLYIAVLRKNFLNIIDRLYEYCDDKDDNEYVLENDLYTISLPIYNLTKQELAIFEECIFEYFDGKNKNDIKPINKKGILYLLEELKNGKK